MSKKKNWLNIILAGVLILTVAYIVHITIRSNQVEEEPLITIEQPQAKDSIDYFKGIYDEKRKVWEEQRDALVDENRKKDLVIDNLRNTRRANNDNIKDEDLLRSIDESIEVLDKLGY